MIDKPTTRDNRNPTSRTSRNRDSRDNHNPTNRTNRNPTSRTNRTNRDPTNPTNSDDRFHRAVYVISVAAELTGVHPQTLRVYERRGLLEPARTAGGSRRYSDADLARLQRIGELTDEGLNLAGVMRVLDLEQQLAKLQGTD